jgi:hypothetical protein
MQDYARRLLPYVATAALSVTFGAWAFRDAPPAPAIHSEAQVSQSARATPLANPSAQAITPEQIRRIVREELGTRSRSPADRAPALPTEEEHVALEASREATSRAEALIAAAHARGTWSPSDRDALRGLIDRMSNEQRTAVLNPLAAAMNRGEIAVGGTFPPY